MTGFWGFALVIAVLIVCGVGGWLLSIQYNKRILKCPCCNGVPLLMIFPNPHFRSYPRERLCSKHEERWKYLHRLEQDTLGD